jgi:hypothetical protein
MPWTGYGAHIDSGGGIEEKWLEILLNICGVADARLGVDLILITRKIIKRAEQL